MRPRAFIALLVCLWIFVGCGSTPTTHYYVLAPTAVTSPPAPASEGLRIAVEPFTVDPPYDRDQLVYRLGADSLEVGFYTYHRWAAPLGDLVALSLAEGLQGTPGIRSIEPWSSSGEYDALLRGRVLYLEEVDTPGSQEARLRLELRLVDHDGVVFWSEEVAGSSAGAMALLWSPTARRASPSGAR